MLLTPARIKSEPVPKPGKIKKLSDGDGLFLKCMATGKRIWNFKFRYAGKENSLSFGPYPETPIEVARDRAVEARAMLRRGENPAAVKREAREAATTDALMTFGRVGAEYMQQKATTKAVKTAKKHAWLFECLKKFHTRPLSSIQTAEIVTACRVFEAQGKSETAHRVAAFAARVYRYANQCGYTTHNPARDLAGALKPIIVESREGITDPVKFATLMRYVDGEDYSFVPVRHALRLLARTAVRPGELRAAEWSEIDMAKGEWLVPAARTKMRKPHWVPLSKQALEILKAQHVISGGGRYVFPGNRTDRRPMSDGAMNAALATLGYKKGGWMTLDAHQPHGFRVSFSSLMNEQGADPVIIEACLAHGKPDKVAATYNRAQYKPERKKLMQDWADLIDTLKKGTKMPSDLWSAPPQAFWVVTAILVVFHVGRGMIGQTHLNPARAKIKSQWQAAWLFYGGDALLHVSCTVFGTICFLLLFRISQEPKSSAELTGLVVLALVGLAGITGQLAVALPSVKLPTAE